MKTLPSGLRAALPVVCTGLFGLALLSCDSTGGKSGEGPSVAVSPGGDALPADHPPLDSSQLPIRSAKTQRLSVAQLRGTVPAAMGKDADGNDIVWMLYSYPGLEKLADVLGEADYANRTSDNLEISPLYLKFMDAAARDVCGKAIDADLKKSDAKTRVILRYVEKTDTVESNPDGVDKNLRYLKLRMHGVKIADDDPTPLVPLRKLFADATAATVSADASVEGWRVVCVGLLTAPEFHLY
ncbi:MAG: hypothetical protein U0441_38460 [Polyangiaceae bacterium]